MHAQDGLLFTAIHKVDDGDVTDESDDEAEEEAAVSSPAEDEEDRSGLVKH